MKEVLLAGVSALALAGCAASQPTATRDDAAAGRIEPGRSLLRGTHIFANQLASHVRTFLIRQPLPAPSSIAAITPPSQKPPVESTRSP